MLPITNPSQLAMKTTLIEYLPTDVINIVDSYFAFSDALEVLTLGSDGQPVDSESNRITSDAMKLALTSPQCDRDILRLIFKNAVDHGYGAFLNKLMADLRLDNQRIILDRVNFSGMDLSKLSFDSVSMRQTNFTAANLHETSLIAADLTQAHGLTEATGQVTVNCMTVFTNAGFYHSPESLRKIIGAKPCIIVLSGPQNKVNYLSLTLDRTRFLVLFRDAVE